MKLKELRAKLNLNQTDLAKITGLSQKSISNYEHSQTYPNVEVLIKLADYFHVSVDELIGHEVPYVLNRVQFNEKQLKLVERIKTLNERQCERVDDFITGIIGAQDARELTIKRLSDN